ncbi:MAG TPA: glycosyltransferase family 4 protein [Bryobacteraceae bacterium]|jgi:glycosyltransferase involved in cell wall biosynthesis
MRAPTPIVLVVRELGSGGIERDVAKLALSLDRSRFCCHVAAYQAEGVRASELRAAGVPILRLDVPNLKSTRALRTAIQFGGFLRKNRIKLVHAWDASVVFAAPLARLLRVPVILSSVLGHRDLLDARSRKQFQSTDRLVDAIVVNCEAMRKHLIQDCSVSPGHIELCYNGVNTGEFYPADVAKPEPVSSASFVIGAVCVLRAEKNLELLQEAFARIAPLVPNSKLLLVGSGPELPKLQANGRRLEIQNHCIFAPAVPAVAPFLRAIDIFVSCSISEAFSNSVLEAMACGCCVVGSRVGGTPELIADGERGLLFESGNVEELVAKLTMLVKDASLRKRLAANAAAFASYSLSMERNVQCMSRIYETMLQQKGVLI